MTAGVQAPRAEIFRDQLIIRQPELHSLCATRYLQLNTSNHVRTRGWKAERCSVHGLVFANRVLAP